MRAITAQSVAFVPLGDVRVMFLADTMPFVSGSGGACIMMAVETVRAPSLPPLAAPDLCLHYLVHDD
jgi:hypothetical protein